MRIVVTLDRFVVDSAVGLDVDPARLQAELAVALRTALPGADHIGPEGDASFPIVRASAPGPTRGDIFGAIADATAATLRPPSGTRP
jgi:hypothetical protein